MGLTRQTYLDAVDAALDVFRTAELGASWTQPSALTAWSVAGLAGHLARAVTTVEQYLEAEGAPGARRIGAGEYYATVVDTSDLDSDLHRTIRRRGDEMAAGGLEQLRERVEAAADRLRKRLPEEPDDRSVAVFQGVVLSLDDYLGTRLVELVVHADDVAVSLGIPTPAFSADAYRVVEDVLVDTARRRHGDLAVVRALARRERDAADALRVF